MKFTKILALLLACMMLLTFVACSGGDGGSSEDDKKTANVDKTKDNKLELGDYSSEFTGYELMKDDDGNDVIAMNFKFTNNSKESQQFSWAYTYEIKQNGEMLDFAVVFESEDSYDTVAKGELDEVAPGETHDVCLTYALKDTTTPVVFDVYNFNDEKDSLTINIA